MPQNQSKAELFPCKKIPDDSGDAKLIGLYRQVQEGMWLQRVKISGGRLSGLQWRKMAELLRRFAPDTPLHLTTRQDIEIHNLQAEKVPAVQSELANASLTCLTAAGDTPRNTIVCPCSGMAAGSVDLLPLAEMLRAETAKVEGIYSLPRKFKMSLSCSDGCGQPWINDLGFVLTSRDGRAGFKVIAAGSLGAKPGVGIALLDWLDWREVAPFVIAAIRVFAEHGDRENRRKARLRHVRERMGDDAFSALLKNTFAKTLAEKDWPVAEINPAKEDWLARETLTFANGDISIAMAEELATLADDDDLRLRIDTHHRIIVFGKDEQLLKQKLDNKTSLSEARELSVSVVACPGKRWCVHGLLHTNEVADKIRLKFAGRLPAGATVCISGCPNGCVHPAVADIGLTGRVTKDSQGKPVEAFDIVTGGHMGRDRQLAVKLAQKVPAEKVIDEIEIFLNDNANSYAGKQ